VVKHDGRKPRHIFRFQGISFASKLLQCCIHIDRVPKSDDVDHEPQSSELIFLSLAVMGVVGTSNRKPPLRNLISHSQRKLNHQRLLMLGRL
jgi:hypothetical protein